MKKIILKPKKNPTIYFRMTIKTSPKKYKFITEKELGTEYKIYYQSYNLFHRKTEKLKTPLEWLESTIQLNK